LECSKLSAKGDFGVSILTRTKAVTRRNRTAPPISVNPARLSGRSVIGTSRVPVGVLLDYVDREALRRDFPSLSAEALESAIQCLKELGEEGALGERINY
jgi:uncharacterized protein (DUF433 family)